MFSTIEVAAKGLLNDPSWNWVFKNTFDAIEDKLNKVCKKNVRGPLIIVILLQTLFVTSGLGILVRFISNLASGDLLCIVNDLSDNTTNLDIRYFGVQTLPSNVMLLQFSFGTFPHQPLCLRCSGTRV